MGHLNRISRGSDSYLKASRSQGHAQDTLTYIRIRQGWNSKDAASQESLLKISWDISIWAVEKEVHRTPLRVTEGRVMVLNGCLGWVEHSKGSNAAYSNISGDI